VNILLGQLPVDGVIHDAFVSTRLTPYWYPQNHTGENSTGYGHAKADSEGGRLESGVSPDTAIRLHEYLS
jgi:hypothetical protein